MLRPRPKNYLEHREARHKRNSCELVYSADIQTIASMISSVLDRQPYAIGNRHATWLDAYGMLDYLLTRREEQTRLLIYCGKEDELFDVAMQWAVNEVHKELENNGSHTHIPG